MPAERSPRRLSSDVRDRDRDRNYQRRYRDDLPLETSRTSNAKPAIKDASETSDRKTKELSETTNPTAAPHSRSFSQRDDRGIAAQDGRHSGRRLTSEHGRWKDSKDEERGTRRANSDLNEKKEKPDARGNDTRTWRHDRFFEMDKNGDQPAKKRRHFREEKLPPESNSVSDAAKEPSKDVQHWNSSGVTERLEERDRVHRLSERNDSSRTFVKSNSFSTRERGGRMGMHPRNRFNVGEYDERFRGRDESSGRQGFSSGGGRAEKWKHDLYYEANTSPTKNEEDPVAKVEALLSL